MRLNLSLPGRQSRTPWPLASPSKPPSPGHAEQRHRAAESIALALGDPPLSVSR
jgi:hypothetical protein